MHIWYFMEFCGAMGTTHFTSACVFDLQTNIYKSDFLANVYKIQWV